MHRDWDEVADRGNRDIEQRGNTEFERVHRGRERTEWGQRGKERRHRASRGSIEE